MFKALVASTTGLFTGRQEPNWQAEANVWASHCNGKQIFYKPYFSKSHFETYLTVTAASQVVEKLLEDIHYVELSMRKIVYKSIKRLTMRCTRPLSPERSPHSQFPWHMLIQLAQVLASQITLVMFATTTYYRHPNGTSSTCSETMASSSPRSSTNMARDREYLQSKSWSESINEGLVMWGESGSGGMVAVIV